MPDRIIRDEIASSDTWLGLKRNTHRLGFIMMILAADDLGNLEATDGSLWRIWRDPLALTDRAAVQEILLGIADAKLVRLYDVDQKRYAHIPKFRQRLRYVNGKHPRPPEALECKEIKQSAEKSQTKVRPKSVRSQSVVRPQTAEVKGSEEKRSEEKGSEALPRTRDVVLVDNFANKAHNSLDEKKRPPDQTGKWWSDLATMVSFGQSLGIFAALGESRDSLYQRIRTKLATA